MLEFRKTPTSKQQINKEHGNHNFTNKHIAQSPAIFYYYKPSFMMITSFYRKRNKTSNDLILFLSENKIAFATERD